MKLFNNKKVLMLILFFTIIIMRIPYIENSPAELGDMWRQIDTESIARNFVKYRFNIFYPQFNYDGPLPNYVQLEFQITTFIIAILYKVFGFSVVLARIVPISFFVISCYFLFKLIEEIYSYKTAYLVTFIYSIIPLNIYYSRAIMPESALLCFFNGGFYYFYKWFKNDKLKDLFISGALISLAISQKNPAVFIGLAILGMCIIKFKHKFLFKWELWVFGILSLVPSILYFKIIEGFSEFKFVTGIADKHIYPKFYNAFLTKEALNFYKINLPKSFTIYLIKT